MAKNWEKDFGPEQAKAWMQQMSKEAEAADEFWSIGDRVTPTEYKGLRNHKSQGWKVTNFPQALPDQEYNMQYIGNQMVDIEHEGTGEVETHMWIDLEPYGDEDSLGKWRDDPHTDPLWKPKESAQTDDEEYMKKEFPEKLVETWPRVDPDSFEAPPDPLHLSDAEVLERKDNIDRVYEVVGKSEETQKYYDELMGEVNRRNLLGKDAAQTDDDEYMREEFGMQNMNPWSKRRYPDESLEKHRDQVRDQTDVEIADSLSLYEEELRENPGHERITELRDVFKAEHERRGIGDKFAAQTDDEDYMVDEFLYDKGQNGTFMRPTKEDKEYKYLRDEDRSDNWLQQKMPRLRERKDWLVDAPRPRRRPVEDFVQRVDSLEEEYKRRGLDKDSAQTDDPEYLKEEFPAHLRDREDNPYKALGQDGWIDPVHMDDHHLQAMLGYAPDMEYENRIRDEINRRGLDKESAQTDDPEYMDAEFPEDLVERMPGIRDAVTKVHVPHPKHMSDEDLQRDYKAIKDSGEIGDWLDMHAEEIKRRGLGKNAAQTDDHEYIHAEFPNNKHKLNIDMADWDLQEQLYQGHGQHSEEAGKELERRGVTPYTEHAKNVQVGNQYSYLDRDGSPLGRGELHLGEYDEDMGRYDALQYSQFEGKEPMSVPVTQHEIVQMLAFGEIAPKEASSDNLEFDEDMSDFSDEELQQLSDYFHFTDRGQHKKKIHREKIQREADSSRLLHNKSPRFDPVSQADVIDGDPYNYSDGSYEIRTAPDQVTPHLEKFYDPQTGDIQYKEAAQTDDPEWIKAEFGYKENPDMYGIAVQPEGELEKYRNPTDVSDEELRERAEFENAEMAPDQGMMSEMERRGLPWREAAMWRREWRHRGNPPDTVEWKWAGEHEREKWVEQGGVDPTAEPEGESPFKGMDPDYLVAENVEGFGWDLPGSDNDCPRCKLPLDKYPAKSRVDNETEICSDCGTDEAMRQFSDPQNEVKNKLDPRAGAKLAEYNDESVEDHYGDIYDDATDYERVEGMGDHFPAISDWRSNRKRERTVDGQESQEKKKYSTLDVKSAYKNYLNEAIGLGLSQREAGDYATEMIRLY